MTTIIDDIENKLSAFFEARNDGYKDTIIKEIYKPLPKGTYPKITIQEIDNSEVISRTTSDGEQTTDLGYQIVCYSRDMEENDYIDSVRFMLELIDECISGNFKMRRIGSTVIQPYITDKTIMTGTVRYVCVYDKETNLIYIS